jgi:hypothetical protein
MAIKRNKIEVPDLTSTNSWPKRLPKTHSNLRNSTPWFFLLNGRKTREKSTTKHEFEIKKCYLSKLSNLSTATINGTTKMALVQSKLVLKLVWPN